MKFSFTYFTDGLGGVIVKLAVGVAVGWWAQQKSGNGEGDYEMMKETYFVNQERLRRQFNPSAPPQSSEPCPLPEDFDEVMAMATDKPTIRRSHRPGKKIRDIALENKDIL
ncbi:uncharacterized protein LOC129004486 [Macrosteles quadrilineatus]|uniref:uncharacterized protein LOC129004486 n=1 Tax=Macrosteles quadrilineatus TaxID=74068 RepID=UPI0023E16715|nr:uncharacterized protein LOC129004486 [Macrosteles quadrilineatus]